MAQITLEEALKKYTELLSEVRLLSAPETEEIEGTEDYRECLVRNFTGIGEMSEEIQSLLDDVIFPLLDNDDELSENQIESLSNFSRALVNTTTMNYLDPILCLKIAERRASNFLKTLLIIYKILKFFTSARIAKFF